MSFIASTASFLLSFVTCFVLVMIQVVVLVNLHFSYASSRLRQHTATSFRSQVKSSDVAATVAASVANRTAENFMFLEL
jgi:hypothetical protein